MRKVRLIFPDVLNMVDFILANPMKNAHVISNDCVLTAEINDEEIVAACTTYKAVLDKMVSPDATGQSRFREIPFLKKKMMW